MTVFAYRGNERLINALEARILEAGFTREGEAELADIVVTYCTNMTALEDLYFGDEGLVQTMSPGTVALDLSPASCTFASELAGVAAVNDVKFVSAPVSVKNKVAEKAFSRENIVCFVGTDEGDIPQPALDMLVAIAADVRAMPNIEAAQLSRAAHTLQNTAEMVAAVETMSLFKMCASTLDEAELARIVPDATSPEAFFIMKAIRKSAYEGDYTVEMLMGEISTAIMCADDCELILPQAEAAFHLFELLAIVGGVDLSPAALELVYEGEGSGAAAKAGLDWSRMQSLYDSGDGEAYHDHSRDEDMEFYDDDPLGLYEDEDGDSDGLNPGFGYSLN